MSLELSILTLNVWGIPFISKDKDTRIKNIAQFLSKSDYDLVSLQELWSDNDYEYLKSVLKLAFPYFHYFHSGVVGSGLAIFSRWPVISVFYHAWSVNGYIHRIQHSDWFGGKGVGFAQVSVNGNLVNVYLAHLHANYNKNSDEYLTHRIVQVSYSVI
jgi:sphingomyelin phosphodiesterase 2